MVKEILHGNMNSHIYVDRIAKILAARSDNGVTAQGMMSQNHIISSSKNLKSYNQKKIPTKTNVVAPNLSKISGRKCL